MPTYEYRCDSCDTTSNVVQKMTDPTLTVCPECGAEGLRKLFNGVGVVFKGSGFYRTDSRGSGKETPSDSKAPAAKSGTNSSTSTSTSSGSSTSSSSSSSTSSSSTSSSSTSSSSSSS